jgi:hypothetical protein
MKPVCQLVFFLADAYIYGGTTLMKRRREKWKIRNDNV